MIFGLLLFLSLSLLNLGRNIGIADKQIPNAHVNPNADFLSISVIYYKIKKYFF
jgi:hypothetical protein